MKFTKVIVVLIILGAICGVNAADVTLDTSTLPSTQGWEFSASGIHAGVLETDMFSVSGYVLTMDNMDEPVNWLGGGASYRQYDVVDGSKGITLEWTSRTTEYEKTSTGGHDVGFYVNVSNGQYRYLVGITTDRIVLDNGAGSHTLSFDATEYHTYRIETIAGSPDYDFYIDNKLQVTLAGRASSSNVLVFGDATSTANARTDITRLVFTQLSKPSSSLATDGTLTFSCGVSTTHASIEWSEDLQGEWMPTAFWNMPVIGTTNSVSLPLDNLPEHAVFRVLGSSQEIQPSPSTAVLTADTNDWGTVSGKVLFLEGNFTPVTPSGTNTPVSRTLCFFEQTRSTVTIPPSETWSTFYSFVLSPFVCSTKSNANGDFSIGLPPGDYSVFVIEGQEGFYANGGGPNGNIWPVHVETNQNTVIQFEILYQSVW